MIIVILAFGLNRLPDLYLTDDAQTYLYPLKPVQLDGHRGLGFWIIRLPLSLPLTLRSTYIIHSITPERKKQGAVFRHQQDQILLVAVSIQSNWLRRVLKFLHLWSGDVGDCTTGKIPQFPYVE